MVPYLAELLLAKGYEDPRHYPACLLLILAALDHLYKDPHINGVRLFLHYGDISDSD